MSTTRSEKLLAVILAGFVVLALSWAYVNIDDSVRDSREAGAAALRKPIEATDGAHYREQQRVGLTGRFSDSNLIVAEDALYALRSERDTARERYRTAIEGGKSDAAALEREYNKLDDRATARAEAYRILTRKNAAAQRRLQAFDDAQAPKVRALQARSDAYMSGTSRRVFALRVLLMFGLLGLSLVVLRRVTERAPRAVPLAQALVGGTGILALTLIVDYSEVSFDFASVGPLGLSFLGALLTIAGFVALQRYMRTQRPARRLRAHECPACGYPAGDNRHCESCGTQLLQDCSSCGQPRRVGVPRCGRCGAA